jgi:hypothetical protein
MKLCIILPLCPRGAALFHQFGQDGKGDFIGGNRVYV